MLNPAGLANDNSAFVFLEDTKAVYEHHLQATHELPRPTAFLEVVPAWDRFDADTGS